MIGWIYCIKNIKNKKIYIGSSKNIERRWKEHRSRLKHGKHHSIKLQRAYDKAKNKDIFEFEIVEVIEDISKIKQREQYWIDYHSAYEKGYNCTSKVDNPKYSHKNIKKKKRKEEKELMYNDFLKVYEEYSDRIKNNRTLKRLLNNGYGKPTVSKCIKLIKDICQTEEEDVILDIAIISGGKVYVIALKDGRWGKEYTYDNKSKETELIHTHIIKIKTEDDAV